MAITKNRFINPLLLLLSLIFSIAITEIGMRVFLKDRLHVVRDERNLVYRHDVNLGWFPIKNSKTLFTGSRSISVENNSRGFRDAEHLLGTNRRIVFLGDSFVWGYDVEKSERFTEKISKKLPDWSVYNLGVSGYGTDQEYLLLKQHFNFYSPNIVFLVICTYNDEVDNSYNKRYVNYFKPYIVVNEGNLEIRGTPVPKNENYFFQKHRALSQFYWIRILTKVYFKLTTPPRLKLKDPTHEILAHMQEYVHSRGSLFLVGLTNQHPELEKFLKDKKIPYVVLGAARAYKYPIHPHWTPKGHTVVSEKIYEFLMKGNHLEMETVPKQKIHTE